MNLHVAPRSLTQPCLPLKTTKGAPLTQIGERGAFRCYIAG